MRFTASPEDFLKGQLLEPGWYPCVIADVDDAKKAKTDGSGMVEIKFKVVAGPNKGAILYQNFSEKAPSFMIEFLEQAFKTVFDKTKAVQLDVSKDQLMNKTCDVHVVRGAYNNKPQNNIDGYKPFSGPTGA